MAAGHGTREMPGMAVLASLTIPVRAARSTFGNAPKGLMTDHQHVVKAALASAFGEGALRPWRLVSNDGRFYGVTGWVNPDLTRAAFDEGCMSIGAAVHLDAYDPPPVGARVELELHASPQRDVRVYDPASGRRKVQSHDVGREGNNARAAYEAWIRSKVFVPRSGIEIDGEIRITNAAATDGIYRNGDRLIRTRIPRVEAKIPVRVVQPANFLAFLHRGVGPLAHVGYGLLMPGGLVDGV